MMSWALPNASANPGETHWKTLAWKSGVYVLMDESVPLYVGRSENLRGRLLSHWHQKRQPESPAFGMTKIITVEAPCLDVASRFENQLIDALWGITRNKNRADIKGGNCRKCWQLPPRLNVLQLRDVRKVLGLQDANS